MSRRASPTAVGSFVLGGVTIAVAALIALGGGQLFVEFIQMRRTRLLNQGGHFSVSVQQVGEYRQQPVAIAGDAGGTEFYIDHSEELAVGAGVGHHRFAAAVLYLHRYRHTVVGMAAENRVNAADA